MRRVYFAVALLMLIAMSTTAFAMTPGNIVFAENWESEIAGNPINGATQWTGDSTSMVVAAGNWGSLNGLPSTNKWVWTQQDFGASMNGVTDQLFHMDMSSNGGPGIGNRTFVYVLDKTGAVFLRWYGDSMRVMPRYGGNVGPQVALSAGTWKDMDIVYNSVSGLATWYVNGSSVYSINAGAGNYFTRVEIQSNNGLANDAILIDNIKVGNVVPEPSSLLAFSVFGIGMMGYIRRRRA